ncbi:hypothetical protein BOC45_07685 [Burkholderia pseudomallei]|nr:hypothetical protein BOC45_07685 [Burkholderia pseudomallei]
MRAAPDGRARPARRPNVTAARDAGGQGVAGARRVVRRGVIARRAIDSRVRGGARIAASVRRAGGLPCCRAAVAPRRRA